MLRVSVWPELLGRSDLLPQYRPNNGKLTLFFGFASVFVRAFNALMGRKTVKGVFSQKLTGLNQVFLAFKSAFYESMIHY